MASAPPVAPSSFWDFSLQLYVRPGVADSCLQLQDEQGVNVNLLLWCAWLDAQDLILDAGRLHSAQKRIHGWDEHYVLPLRQLRRRMKAEFGTTNADIEALRTQIKQAELLAEKQVQLLLESELSTWDKEVDPAVDSSADWSNVRFYLHHLSVTEATIARLLELFAVDC